MSSTGDAKLDKEFPLPERYWISAASAAHINEALNKGNRVIALGSTVTRALETAGTSGRVQDGTAVSSLRLAAQVPRKITSGILTGLHEPTSSHVQMLSSFLPLPLLRKAYDQALARGYLWHEYGDSCLILD